MIIIYNRTNINHESEFKLMKKNKLFLALMAGTIVISGCSAKSEKKKKINQHKLIHQKEQKNNLNKLLSFIKNS